MPITDTSSSQPPSVAIVLCTYNGSQYVELQTKSLLDQQHDVSIHASDDVSTDDTVAKISSCLREGIDTLHVNPENTGFVRNFEGGLKRALNTDSSYIALSDQDDIWDEQRIAAGMQAIMELERIHGADAPLLVHSDLSLINANGQQTHSSFLAYRRYRISSKRSLGIMLGENGVMGNTILMNRALLKLCLPFPTNLHVHDYWIALMAELFGHRTLLEKPLVNYRLHQNNASNTAKSMSRGPFALMSTINWQKLRRRDFKLPYKEDSRLQVLKNFLTRPDDYPKLSEDQKHRIGEFVSYLEFTQPRWKSLGYLLFSGIARRGLRYRLRLIFAVLLTARYSRT